jgi:hypothetical protein
MVARAAVAQSIPRFSMLAAIPLMIVPLIGYNLVMIGLLGGGIAELQTTIFSTSMMSGATWTMSMGDLLIVISLVLSVHRSAEGHAHRTVVGDRSHAVDVRIRGLPGRVPAGA